MGFFKQHKTKYKKAQSIKNPLVILHLQMQPNLLTAPSLNGPNPVGMVALDSSLWIVQRRTEIGSACLEQTDRRSQSCILILKLRYL